jgi:hypothetical protein
MLQIKPPDNVEITQEEIALRLIYPDPRPFSIDMYSSMSKHITKSNLLIESSYILKFFSPQELSGRFGIFMGFKFKFNYTS